MATFETLKLVQGEVLYLYGATLNAIAAREGQNELLDCKGFFVEDEEYYRVTSDGIEKAD